MPGASAPEIRVCYDVANAHVYLDLINTGTAACTFTVTANAYRGDGPWTYEIPAGKQIEQHWPVGRRATGTISP